MRGHAAKKIRESNCVCVEKLGAWVQTGGGLRMRVCECVGMLIYNNMPSRVRGSKVCL